MAGAIWKILRSLTLGNRPSGRAYGEPYVNFAENQFGVINSSGAAQDLLGVPIFSTTATYAAGNAVNHGGGIYIAQGTISAGAWNASQWSQVASLASIPAVTPPFPSGTEMIFVQSTAPTGWTRVTTSALDDSLLRVVASATPSTGGTNGFSAFNATTTTAGHTNSTNEIPYLSNIVSNATYFGPQGTATGITGSSPNYAYSFIQSGVTSSFNGGGAAHTHGITTAIKYIDSLLATKN